ncbi:DegT/DnrJ/EryC1/StrS family aminotransferase [Winogradskyella maritima]|uniref:DegT/DnrJ/EryC1/StrS family aminotransferase n=1 Tax=Winogradskyella maritima TaxID=1517766 RepID=A0ABV8AG94_9FLAO|nr:DegT/DnrJ/EryC1/StrS family aminotransferase [Winogradskyella maritima]
MIKFLDLKSVNERFRSQFEALMPHFLDSGHYILGEDVSKFESEFASYCGTNYCVGTANGLDALTLILKGYLELGKLKLGDKVMVPANTYMATILAIINAGLEPVLIEPNDKTFNIDIEDIVRKHNPNIKAVMVVHLYGQLCDMKAISEFTKKHGLLLFEDAAQAHGAIAIDGIKAGNFSDAAAFSFYPTKNLGALGDAGVITTNDHELKEVLKKLRNYGSSKRYINDYLGLNSRLSGLQARVLSIKLKYLDADNDKRRAIAKRYFQGIVNPKITLPSYSGSLDHVFYLFVIRVSNRDAFRNYMTSNDIETLVHYPVAPHQQNAFSKFKALSLPITERMHEQVVSLPIYPTMPQNLVNSVIDVVNAY